MSERPRPTRSPEERAESHWAIHDWSDPEELTTSIVTAVADVTGDDPLDLPRLRKVINPDALNNLFAQSPNTTHVRIQFEYAGCAVDITGDGCISIDEF